MTTFPTVYFHPPPTAASIFRLFRASSPPPHSVRKSFGPNNASALLPYTALATVQRSCRWLTAALTMQLAASLIGLKSGGCVKVRQEEKRRILTRRCLALVVSPSSRFSCRLVGAFGLLFTCSALDAPVMDVARFQQQLESTMQKGLKGAAAREAPSRSCRINLFLVGK